MNIKGREMSEPEVKAYIHKLEDILRELRPVLRDALYAHYELRKKADELYDRITNLVGKE